MTASLFFAWVGPPEAYPTPPQDEPAPPLTPIGAAEFWTSDFSYVPAKDAVWHWLLYALRGYSTQEIAVRFRRNRKEVEKAVRERMTVPLPTDIANAKRRFQQQRWQAHQRGVAWEFSFAEWMDLWRQSGRWDHRGKRKGQYVMARAADEGPYAPGNVRICTVEENRAEDWAARRAIA